MSIPGDIFQRGDDSGSLNFEFAATKLDHYLLY